ncbi:hypothetical protein [Bradyrhizobium sp. BR 10289]|uniref:hypothetical protein n=1 Tax=Bradyrhizobium sp. BR 10289 TaxID=2749993 RepID=UPI001C651177|nr:hypothetical protein [Bradyrhizobium sp. BR 10289]MBW7970971.1 hypothetical protein [Bradyrhizobium sp. BR 10289]
MTVEWNDSGFPDHLPAVEPHKLTAEETTERLEGVLKAAGIKIKLGGCGCCGSPWVEATFPDGATADVEHISLEVDGYSR